MGPSPKRVGPLRSRPEREAPRTLLEIDEKARRDGHASLTLEETSERARAEEALRYGPYVLRYLAGYDVEPA